ncbi:unnamed protein product, partial [marine sediment metagenome]
FIKDEKSSKITIEYALGYLNSNVIAEILKVINPTLNTSVGDVLRIPFINLNDKEYVEKLVSENIAISKMDWDSRETSLDFRQNELCRINREKLNHLDEVYELFKEYWKVKSFLDLAIFCRKS